MVRYRGIWEGTPAEIELRLGIWGRRPAERSVFTVREKGVSVADWGRDRERERRRLCEKAGADRESQREREREREVCKLKAGIDRVEMVLSGDWNFFFLEIVIIMCKKIILKKL